jgi:hypothetical protein
LHEGVLKTEPVPVEIDRWRAEAVAGGGGQIKNAIGDLVDAAEQTPWPDVRMAVEDLGWRTPLPGSPLERQLAGARVGDFSRTTLTGGARTLLLVVEEGRPDFSTFEDQPMLLRTLGYQAQAAALRKQTRERLVGANAIEFSY